jgi:hypothetical protein
LTATDSKGLTSTVTRNLYPTKVPITFATSPSGLKVMVNGTTLTGSTTVTSWDKYVLNVSAATQNDVNGKTWFFSNWSDGGVASHAITTTASSATYTATFVSAPLFRDGFESGTTSRWTFATGLTVQQQDVYAGSWAARATSAGAATYAYTQLSSSQIDLFDRFRFKVLSQSQNVTLGKFRKTGGSAVVSFNRSASGKLCLRNDITVASYCSVSPSLGAWHTLEVHAKIGTSGLTEVWLDGVKLADLTRTQNLGTDPIGRVQIGNSQTDRTYDMILDDVIVDRAFI